MTTLFAPTALLPGGWAARRARDASTAARIAAVDAGARPSPATSGSRAARCCRRMPNLHSHAFQRAMAGMTERRGPGDDSFWTWRELMYRFLDVLTPDDVEAIAALAYVEMLEAGYAGVAEFHYLHHQPGGDALRRSGRARAPHRRRRRRDRHRPDAAAGALQLRRRRGARRSPAASGASATTSTASCACARPRAPALPADAVLGAAPHSLRATTPDQIAALLAAVPDGPLHIHAAEQVQEVEQVEAWLGAPAGRVPARPARRRPALVPDPRHAHDAATRPPGSPRSGAVAGPLPDHRGQPRRRHLPRRRLPRGGGALGIGSDFERPHRAGRGTARPRIQPAPARCGRATSWPRPAPRSAARSTPARSPAARRRSARDCGAIAPGALGRPRRHRPRPPDAGAARRRPAARRLDLRRRRPAWCARSGRPAATWSATAATSRATGSRRATGRAMRALLDRA